MDSISQMKKQRFREAICSIQGYMVREWPDKGFSLKLPWHDEVGGGGRGSWYF